MNHWEPPTKIEHVQLLKEIDELRRLVLDLLTALRETKKQHGLPVGRDALLRKKMSQQIMREILEKKGHDVDSI
jgi:hypothetical protein